MKKIQAAALAIVCALCCVAAIAGCSNGAQSSAQKPVSTEALVGVWSNVPPAPNDDPAASVVSTAAISADDASSNASDSASAAEPEADGAAQVENYPLVATYLQLDEGGKATLFIGGYVYDGTWSIENNAAKLAIQGTNDVTLKFSGEKLMLTQDDLQLALTKTTEDELFGSEGNLEMQTVEPVISDIEAANIVDNETVSIKVTGKGTDFTGDPCYRLAITNKTQQSIYLGVEEAFKVGDKDINAGMGEYLDAGQTLEEVYLYFPASELEGGVDALNNVSGKIVAYSVDAQDQIGDALGSYDFRM